MSWRQARDQTLQTWLEIRAELGRAHQIDLLTKINLSCPLCDQAWQDRADQLRQDVDLCAFCAVSQQAGGCRELSAEISTRIAERDWDAARKLADEFIEVLRGLELPDEGPEQVA